MLFVDGVIILSLPISGGRVGLIDSVDDFLQGQRGHTKSPGPPTLPSVPRNRNTVNSLEPVEIPAGEPGKLENPGAGNGIQDSRRAEACPVEKMRRISLRNCPYCGCSKIYTSSSTTLWHKVCSLFLLRLVRCHVCMRRHYRPIFLPAAVRNVAGEPMRREAIGVWTIKDKKRRSA
jgi:hypothetical protein